MKKLAILAAALTLTTTVFAASSDATMNAIDAKSPVVADASSSAMPQQEMNTNQQKPVAKKHKRLAKHKKAAKPAQTASVDAQPSVAPAADQAAAPQQ